MKNIESKIIKMAKTDFEFGLPFEDYREFSKYCKDDGIEPTEDLWNIYQDSYGPEEGYYD